MENKNRKSEESSLHVETIGFDASSRLTEDLLCSIVSRLKLKEAARTSVISRRWRYIWTHRPDFEFDAKTMVEAHPVGNLYKSNCPLTWKEKNEFLRGMADKFISSVNSVMQQHQGDKVEKLAIEFYLDKTHAHHLDAWVHFAVAKKTTIFGLYVGQPFLNLEAEIPLSNFWTDVYEFPIEFLGGSSIKELYLTHCSLKPPRGFNGFKYLTLIWLYYMNISEEYISRLLSNCSALQKLTFQRCGGWVTLSIPQSLSQLRHLAVLLCEKTREIEINAENLRKLDYDGDPTNIKYTQSLQLEEVRIHFEADYRKRNLNYYLTKVSRNLPHLKAMNFSIFGYSKVAEVPNDSCTFIHLKHLEFTWKVQNKMSLTHLATLLDATPFLEELDLRLSTVVREQPPQSLTKLQKALPKHPHSRLKAITIRNFSFDKWQIDIAVYLLINAFELETMTIKKSLEVPERFSERDVKNLSQEVPADVQFAISDSFWWE